MSRRNKQHAEESTTTEGEVTEEEPTSEGEDTSDAEPTSDEGTTESLEDAFEVDVGRQRAKATVDLEKFTQLVESAMRNAEKAGVKGVNLSLDKVNTFLGISVKQANSLAYRLKTQPATKAILEEKGVYIGARGLYSNPISEQALAFIKTN